MKFNTQAAKEDRGGQLHPEGTWEATIIGAEARRSKTNRDMVVITWKTEHGKLNSYHAYVDQYPGLFLNAMYAIGFDEGYFEAGPSMDEVALDCLRRQVNISVTHEERKDKPGSFSARVEPVEPTVPF